VFELLTADQMQRADALAIEQGADSFALMQAAATTVASVVKSHLPPGGRVTIVAGSGNNGGDGAVAAQMLADDGCRVELVRLGSNQPTRADAQRAFAQWQGPTHIVATNGNTPAIPAPADGAIATADVLVDALLGAGLSRTVAGGAALLINAINAGKGVVVAVDLPSGIDGNTGQPRNVAVQADHTVTFFRYKPGHMLYPGRAYCGQLQLVQIGIDAQVLNALQPNLALNHPTCWQAQIPVPTATGHKFDQGHVLVRGGDVSHTGAARLSAGAALRCGAGLVTLACPHDALTVNASQLTAVMLSACDSADEWRQKLADKRITAAVLGPANGVDEQTRLCVESTLYEGLACVLDADALTCFATQRERLLNQLQRSQSDVVMTPHEGEFKRLFGDCTQSLPASKIHYAVRASELSGAVIVLKGADTVIVAPDGRVRINANAPPWLATAGAGDVLAGVIGALMARGMAAFDAASAGVWLHADAACSLGYPLTAEDLTVAVGKSLGQCSLVKLPLNPLGLE